MQCSKCGALQPPGTAFCGQCGAAQVTKNDIPANKVVLLCLIAVAVALAATFGGYWVGRNDPAATDAAGLATANAPGPVAANPQPVPPRPATDTPAPPAAAPPAPAPAPPPVQAPAFLNNSVTLREWKYYVILGSAPQGSGNAATRAAQLNRCLGYQPATDYTYAFEGLAPNLEFVHLGGYSTAGQANRVAAWARGCVPDAYVKRAKFLFD